MSLTASMWTSVSGLLAHGEKMNVIGNNISNVNTVGYKSQRMDFQDFVYQYIGTAAGMGQVGRGTSIGIVMNDYSQGSLETTTSATDIAIQGNGFFSVKPLTNNNKYYTRAGNFTFNKDGYLVDPHGYALQGWKIDRDVASQIASGNRTNSGIIGTGSPVDISLDTFTCPPRHTTQVTLPVNLRQAATASTDDNSSDPDNPFFSLIQSWDATQEPPLGDNLRAYQTTIEVYDEGGRQHKLTVYFDRVSGSSDPSAPNYIEGYTDSESYWEFIVTMEPSSDVRDFNSMFDSSGMSPTSPNVPDRLKGLLATGTMTFNSAGALKDMSCFVPTSEPGNTGDTWWTGAVGQEVVNLDKFVAAPINSNGFPVICPNFSGTAGLQTAYGYDASGLILDPTKPNPNAQNRLIALDFGISSKNSAWNFLPDPSGRTAGTYIDSSGADTGLVTASGVSRTFVAQETDSQGNLIWQSGAATASAPAGVTPSTSWSAASPPSNATQWTHSWSLAAGAVPANVSFTNASSAANTLVAAPGSPTNNADSTFDSGTITGIRYVRTNSQSPHPTTADILGAQWNYSSTSGGYDIYTDAAGNQLQVPVGNLPTNPGTAAELAAQLSGNPPSNLQVDNGSASEWYWNVSDGSSVQLVTTIANTDPTTGATNTSSTSNATEYYWTDDVNSGVVATTPTNANPSGSAWVAKMTTVTRSSKYFINGFDGLARVDPTYATTNLGDSFFEHNGVRQDGFTYGDLRYVSVSSDGVLSAAYSNGITLQLYQIVLYDFPSDQNLRREGGNLFTETRESGVPSSGAAGSGTFGTTHGSSLEQSNADLSREFVNMITTQRGFQANSKTITTVDTMLETVIGMKR